MKKNIKIIYTSDVHGKITSYDFVTNKYENYGLSRLKTYLNTLDSNYLLLDNGDVLQGSPLVDYARKNNLSNPVAKQMNQLSYKYMTLGNHDFNYGKAYLSEFISSFNGTVICANIIDSKTNKPVFQPYVIHTIDEIRIGIIGLLTEYVPVWEKKEHIEDFLFTNANETLTYYTDLLKDKVDLIICLYHGGFERDLLTNKPYPNATIENRGYELSLNKDLHVLLTGHQHIPLVLNTGKKTIIQTAFNAINFGVVDVIFEKTDKWSLLNIEGKLLSTSDYSIDKATEDLLKNEIKETNHYLDQIVGTVKTDFSIIDPLAARIKKHPLVQLVNNIQLDVTNADISLYALPNNTKGFNNSVSLRALSETFVFENSLYKMQITGKILRSALEKTATYFAIKQGDIAVSDSFLFPKVEHYNYDIYDGIDYEITVSNPYDNRVTKLLFKGNPVLDSDVFTLAINSYRGSGSGGYDMFNDAVILDEYNISYLELVADYIAKNPNLELNIINNYSIKK